MHVAGRVEQAAFRIGDKSARRTPRAKDRDALQCKSKISLDSGILNLPWRLLLHYCNSPYAIVERYEQNPLRRLCFLSQKPTMNRHNNVPIINRLGRGV
jgi:hypothetical protein